MEKFRTCGRGRWIAEAKIEKVEIERETEQSVWTGGRRNAKKSDFECYHDSWEIAHDFLADFAQRKVDLARAEFERHKSALGNVKGMKKP